MAGLVLLGGAILLVLMVWFSRPRQLAYGAAGDSASSVPLGDSGLSTSLAPSARPEPRMVELAVDVLVERPQIVGAQADERPSEMGSRSFGGAGSHHLNPATSTGSRSGIRIRRTFDHPQVGVPEESIENEAQRTVTYPMPIPVPVQITIASPDERPISEEPEISPREAVSVSQDRPFESRSAVASSLTFVQRGPFSEDRPVPARQWQGSQSSIARVSSVVGASDVARRRALLAGAGLAVALMVAARH